MRKKTSGFTLVELLVVIGILAALAGILLPVLAGARERARGTSCTANLSQLAKAMLMYADDYDGRLPPEWSPAGQGYREVLEPYVVDLRVFVCPSQDDDTYVSYGLPAWVAYEALWLGSTRLSAPRDGASAILLAENWSSYYSTRDPVHWPTRWFPEQNNVAWERHTGGANYAFADGHVKWLKRGATYQSQCTWWIRPHQPRGECGGRRG